MHSIRFSATPLPPARRTSNARWLINNAHKLAGILNGSNATPQVATTFARTLVLASQEPASQTLFRLRKFPERFPLLYERISSLYRGLNGDCPFPDIRSIQTTIRSLAQTICRTQGINPTRNKYPVTDCFDLPTIQRFIKSQQYFHPGQKEFILPPDLTRVVLKSPWKNTPKVDLSPEEGEVREFIKLLTPKNKTTY